MAQPPSRLDPHEPSMEEILASIRSILSEEEQRPLPPPPPETLELTESMLVAALPGQDAKASVEPEAPVRPVPMPSFQAQPEAPQQAEAKAPAQGEGGLLGPMATAAAAAALSQLARAVADERRTPVHRAPGPTIEDVVREEMRPLLKAWLDQHLPPMVERLVRAEIERVMGRLGS